MALTHLLNFPALNVNVCCSAVYCGDVSVFRLQSIIDRGSVPPQNLIDARAYLKLSHFSTREMEQFGYPAAVHLCSWIIHSVKYSDIVTKVEPSRVALNTAQDNLTQAKNQVHRCHALSCTHGIHER